MLFLIAGPPNNTFYLIYFLFFRYNTFGSGISIFSQVFQEFRLRQEERSKNELRTRGQRAGGRPRYFGAK